MIKAISQAKQEIRFVSLGYKEDIYHTFDKNCPQVCSFPKTRMC